jgi:hypothetical protein
MIFMPKIRNEFLILAGAYAQEALPGFIVQVINGDTVNNGGEAEALANDVIDRAEFEGKSVLFIAANMAQRSFSVKQITELYLAYDAGQEGATI